MVEIKGVSAGFQSFGVSGIADHTFSNCALLMTCI